MEPIRFVNAVKSIKLPELKENASDSALDEELFEDKNKIIEASTGSSHGSVCEDIVSNCMMHEYLRLWKLISIPSDILNNHQLIERLLGLATP